MVFLRPMILGNQAAATGGKTPTAISGWPILALSEAITISQKAISSQPPPRERPFTSATVVTSKLAIMRNISWKTKIISSTLSGV
ncbi:MAG: hypothetical protein A4E66_02457 [Syntrophus sp. PtaB.Bin001]|nr:MAG: hypothetical protein A4E66_02457 [Syntrophus sp. PtaB.Bin001]